MSSNLKIWRESASLVLAAKSMFSQPNRFNYKILCLKRSTKSKFMPETYVFPGGNVSKSDSNEAWYKLYENFGFSRHSFDELRAVENVPTILQNDEENSLPKHLAFRICAIRETFEECGLLLCISPKISSEISKWASFIGGHDFIMWQRRVQGDPGEFLHLCKHFQIIPDVWALRNWSNWMTPPTLPTLKFNTIFFIATLHQMPTVHADEKEIQGLMWATPDELIQMNSFQSVMLPVPQFYEISRLKTMVDIDNLANFASERAKYGFETYCPHRISIDDGVYSILPGDDLYPRRIDMNNSEIPYLNHLPDSWTKNRILHKSEYSNSIQVENFKPKCNHIAPGVEQVSKL